MSENKQIQFVKGSAVLILSNLVLKGINFLLLPLYTKYLPPEALGVSDTITSMTSIMAPLLVLGLDSAFSAFYFDRRDEEHYATVFNTIWFTLFVSGMVPIIMSIGAGYFSIILFGTKEYRFCFRVHEFVVYTVQYSA